MQVDVNKAAPHRSWNTPSQLHNARTWKTIREFGEPTQITEQERYFEGLSVAASDIASQDPPRCPRADVGIQQHLLVFPPDVELADVAQRRNDALPHGPFSD